MIYLQYIPMSSMVADGLIKLLPTIQFRNFVKQLGLVQCDIDTNLNRKLYTGRKILKGHAI